MELGLELMVWRHDWLGGGEAGPCAGGELVGLGRQMEFTLVFLGIGAEIGIELLLIVVVGRAARPFKSARWMHFFNDFFTKFGQNLNNINNN